VFKTLNKLSTYLTGNTPILYYKDDSVSVASGKKAVSGLLESDAVSKEYGRFRNVFGVIFLDAFSWNRSP